MPEPILEYKIIEHGKNELRRRGISEEFVRQCLQQPEQRKSVRIGRDVLQRRIHEHAAQAYTVGGR